MFPAHLLEGLPWNADFSSLLTTPSTMNLTTRTPSESVITAPADYTPIAIDFRDATGRVYGFPYAHLLHYFLEKNPASAHDPNVPPDRMVLSFSTHDVTLLGWRLSNVLLWLGLARISSIIVRDTRFANMDKEKAYISEISVKAVEN